MVNIPEYSRIFQNIPEYSRMEHWKKSEVKNLSELYGYYKLPIGEIIAILNKKPIIVINKLILLGLIEKNDLVFILRNEMDIDRLDLLYKIQNDLDKRILVLST